MQYPTFAHGHMANIEKAIAEGRIKYPSYIWCTDQDVYCFLNKDGELEKCGIPQLTGTLENQLILSSLDDGLYEVKGQHKITANDETTFYSFSYIFVIVQTIDGRKKIRRITADDLTTYTVEDDLTVTSDVVATATYLKENGYATESYLDAKIEILKAEIEADLDSYIEEKVIQVIDDTIEDIHDEDIEDLFNN